jgi:fatty acid desaturase
MAFDWAVILATIFFCIQFFNPLTYFVAVLIIGARMHALAILMHDATHYRFLKNRKWNDRLTNWLTMFWLFTSIEQYRANHLAHHRHLNTDDDPDWVAKLGKRKFTFPKTKTEFILTALSYLSLIHGVSDAIWMLGRFKAQAKKKGKESKAKVEKLAFYAILFTALTLTGGWVYFLIFWIVPYMSTFFMYQYIRSVAEHFGELAYDHDLSSSRSIRANLLERFFLAPHQVGYHLEHHLYPGVPFYRLPELHDLLMTDPVFRRKAHITHGFFSGLMNELGEVGKKEQVNLGVE